MQECRGFPSKHAHQRAVQSEEARRYGGLGAKRFPSRRGNIHRLRDVRKSDGRVNMPRHDVADVLRVPRGMGMVHRARRAAAHAVHELIGRASRGLDERDDMWTF